MTTPEFGKTAITMHEPNVHCTDCPRREGTKGDVCGLDVPRAEIRKHTDIDTAYQTLVDAGYDMSYLKDGVFLPGITEFEVYCSKRKPSEDVSILVEQFTGHIQGTTDSTVLTSD
ncbi:hypothetical protein HY469_05410 [Candidatus Roizmanbacteria bacterium]|nr:hypothetical protein [Candidatus Roizmanbacteria bacterium]